MGYKVAAKKRLNLPEDVADDLWIEIRHPKLMDWGVMSTFLQLVPDAKAGETKTFNVDAARDLATGLIVDWNLTDIDGTDGRILPIPSVDPASWSKVPSSAVITLVMQSMGDGMSEVQPDPN